MNHKEPKISTDFVEASADFSNHVKVSNAYGVCKLPWSLNLHGVSTSIESQPDACHLPPAVTGIASTLKGQKNEFYFLTI